MKRSSVGVIAVMASLAVVAVPPTASAEVSAKQIGDFRPVTYIATTPAAPELLFVVERGGRIWLMQEEERLDRPFLNISSIVRAFREDSGTRSEQGLLSMAFPPDYAHSRRFYVYFTNNDSDIEIDEFKRSRANPTRANLNSRRQVMVIPHPFAQNHYGGQLNFGPAGPLLYFATGDGGAGQRANAPDLSSLLGKVIRIDPRAHGAQPYRIPASNPYVGAPGRDEILAYGLRNPWRWSLAGARLTMPDVGQSEFEEINALRLRDLTGANFGWPEYEGFELFEPSLPGRDPVTFPLHVYSHDDSGGCSITGGYFVRDPELTDLFRRYLYVDFCTGELRSLRINFGTGRTVGDQPVGINAARVTTFGEGVERQIYFGQLDGRIFRLEQAAG